MNILLEYIIVFIIVLIIITFINKINKNNLPKGVLTPELLYLKKIYHINISKENIKKIYKITNLINTFFITNIYIILMYLLKGWILRIIVGVILLILLIIICYGLLGRFYSKKEGRKNV